VPWANLRQFTAARVALGRAGNGLPTAAHLAFQAAHAAARDAVHARLDIAALRDSLAAAGIESIAVRSEAADRQTYLRRPDLGRRLLPADRVRLAPAPGIFAPGTLALGTSAMGRSAMGRSAMGRSALGVSAPGTFATDTFAFVVCDGLSATAVARHAAAVLARAMPALRAQGIALAPVVVAEQGRVALGDDIAEALGAEAVAVLIGERPGLSAADSLGIYLTWHPSRGRNDAERNCISNIRPEGLPPASAADKLLWLIGAMRRLRLTGIDLKDEQTTALPPEARPV
jgi:ethanolamine ammonia-lyase small subunit